MMKNYYNVIVAGAGPAGSTAARYAAMKGASVLLLEKDRDIGVPVRCAEGVGAKGLLKIIDHIDPKWIAATIHGFRLVAPDGTPVQARWNDSGYVLHRKLFDYDLARMAADQGADIMTKAYVFDLVREQEAVKGVRVRYGNRDINISADIVIAADGVESRIGRWAGIRTFTDMGDMESCAQATVGNLDIDQDLCEFFFSNEQSPGGYIWVFPKGNRTANVGLGISGLYSKNKSASAYLKEFLSRRFPGKPVLSYFCGAVPCDKTLKQITAPGFMIVGDAAHQANPISGGGIVSGMYAGMLAGKVAAVAVQEKDFSRKRLQAYENEWNKTIGRDHERFYRIKLFIDQYSDEKLNRLAHELIKIPLTELNLLRIFKIALKSNPKLIFDAIRIFSK